VVVGRLRCGVSGSVVKAFKRKGGGVWGMENDGGGVSDLNRSRERASLRGRTIAQCWANVRPRASMHVWPGNERSSTGAWRGSERSPSAG
jgi:hypothetical protein